jgi:site-specific recombinase XerD
MTDITIEEAIEAYLEERKSELSDSSIQNHRYQLKQFRLWIRGADGVDSLDDIDPIGVSRFRRYRASDLNSNTMYNQLSSLRLFLRFCSRMRWVDESLPESVVLPTRSGASRDSRIDIDRLEGLLDELETYRYASRAHVILTILSSTGCRIGTLRGLDVSDIHLSEQWVDIVHRPDTGTPLKNAASSEREMSLHGWVCDVLRSWIDDRRPECVSSDGRKCLVSTPQGRVSRSSIRRTIYRVTACGSATSGCGCDADRPSKCPDSVSPHDIRRSAISAWLNDGVGIEYVSGRVDSSPSTIESHYDAAGPSERRERRRDAFDM